MLKYAEVAVTFGEVPSEVTLCINITGCPLHCKGCHSPHLWEDIGEELKPVVVSDLIAKNDGITCIAFMGGDASPSEIYELAKWVRNNTELKICWYSGEQLRPDIELEYFDYIKTGPYKEELGGLDSVATNQRFYARKERKDNIGDKTLYYYLEDITYKFQKQ